MKLLKVAGIALAGCGAMIALVVLNEKLHLCEKHCPFDQCSCNIKCPWCKHEKSDEDTAEF